MVEQRALEVVHGVGNAFEIFDKLVFRFPDSSAVEKVRFVGQVNTIAQLVECCFVERGEQHTEFRDAGKQLSGEFRIEMEQLDVIARQVDKCIRGR